MKHLKRFVALFAALALVLAMAAPAFAATGKGNDNNGVITVKGAIVGKEYKIYRIFDLESFDSDKNAYSYKVNNDWNGFSAPTYFTLENGYVKWMAAKSETAAAGFAVAAKEYLDAHDSIQPVAKETATATGVKFENLPLGYYLVVTNVGALCSLNTTASSVEIREKNGVPTVDKKIVEGSNLVSDNDASIGDTVKYETTINVLDAEPTDYVLHDKMENLELVADSIVVKIGDRTLSKDADYSVSTTNADECTFEITFNSSANLKTNDVVKVTYSATVAPSASIGGEGNLNETYLKYGDKISNKSGTKTFVWKFDVFKYTMTGEQKIQLADAEFILYKQVASATASATKYAQFDSTGKLTGWVNDKENATVLKSKANANTVVSGLGSGTYYLEEIEAPKGYNKLAAPITIEISSSKTVGENLTATIKQNTDPTNGTIEVLNNAGTTLPGTGGIGTTIFYLIGGGLMVAAAVLLIAKKRMENK